jgi:predicted DNA-binding protein (MmcQ/YjbR family)
MDADAIRALCESLPAATWDYPFGPGVRVYRVASRIFALVDDGGASVSLKCDPGLADALRQTFSAITPGYHLNKRHWNTIRLDGMVPAQQVADLVRHAHELVLRSLPKKQRAALDLSAHRTQL